MNISEVYAHYFEKEQLVAYFAQYELYYQISLGNYVYRTTLDADETIEKLEELDLKVDLQTMIQTLGNIIDHFSDFEEFGDEFDYYVRQQACLQSLNDFVKQDNALLNASIFVDTTADSITADKFFDKEMQKQFDLEIDSNIERWNDIVKFNNEQGSSI